MSGKLIKAIGDIPGQDKVQETLQKGKSLIVSGTKKSHSTLQGNYASLCMLSYERPNFLRNTLQSLRDAPGYPYELIIHDDGSTDSAKQVQEILRDERYKGATIIENAPGHNQGQGIALNRMFNMAKGDPIIKLDADLQYYNGWLLEVIRLMKENPSIGLLGLLHYYHEPVHSKKTVINRYDEWSSHTHILGSAFALRRETWEELGPFEEHSDAFAEDYDMQIRVSESDKWVCALPKESLVENLGMGLGNSTVVLATDEHPGGEVAKFNKEPYIIGKETNG